MIADSDGKAIIDCMRITVVDLQKATLDNKVTPTVDLDDAVIDCVATTTFDLNSKSEIDYVAGNRLNEPVYPGGSSWGSSQSRKYDPNGNNCQNTNTFTLANLNDILDAEQAILTFDNAPLCTRFACLARLRKYSHLLAGIGWTPDSNDFLL